jgi:hypothetical protein
MLLQLLKQILPSAASAAAVAATLRFIFGRWWKKADACAAAIAIGGGYIAGHVLTAGWSSLPPRNATHWVFWFAVIGTIVGTADAFVRPRATVRVIGWTIVCAIACRLILQPKFSYDWRWSEGWVRVITITLAIVLLTWSLQVVDRQSFGRSSMFSIMTIVCAGTAISLMLAGSLLFGQLACVISAILMVLFLAEMAFPALSACGAGAIPLSLLCSGLWLSGHFYAELPIVSALLLALAPAVALLAPVRENSSQWRALAHRTALATAPVIVAVAIAFHSSPPLDY